MDFAQDLKNCPDSFTSDRTTMLLQFARESDLRSTIEQHQLDHLMIPAVHLESQSADQQHYTRHAHGFQNI